MELPSFDVLVPNSTCTSVGSFFVLQEAASSCEDLYNDLMAALLSLHLDVNLFSERCVGSVGHAIAGIFPGIFLSHILHKQGLSIWVASPISPKYRSQEQANTVYSNLSESNL